MPTATVEIAPAQHEQQVMVAHGFFAQTPVIRTLKFPANVTTVSRVATSSYVNTTGVSPDCAENEQRLQSIEGDSP